MNLSDLEPYVNAAMRQELSELKKELQKFRNQKLCEPAYVKDKQVDVFKIHDPGLMSMRFTDGTILIFASQDCELMVNPPLATDQLHTCGVIPDTLRDKIKHFWNRATVDHYQQELAEVQKEIDAYDQSQE